MSDHMNCSDILLVGTGNMGRAHAKVLKDLGLAVYAVGRSAASAVPFQEQLGIDVELGGIDQWVEKHADHHPPVALVAVQANLAPSVLETLLPVGFDRILVEKPCGHTKEQAEAIANLAQATDTDVFVAYNRRFYSSTLAAETIIEEDGGVTGLHFEFTERNFDPVKQDLQQWFIGNDTHVMDLAFFFAGMPRTLNAMVWNNCTVGGEKNQAVFIGSGETENNIPFSYRADWFAPGRWGVEIMTRKHRLVFRPMEKLYIQKIGSFAVEEYPLDDHLDIEYKPGLFLEDRTFLDDPDNPRLLTIQQQRMHLDTYYQMLLGNC